MSRSSPITAQQWSQVQRLLDELELLPQSERRAGLATREIPDPRVREEVEGLIDAESKSGYFLEDSPWADNQPRAQGLALPPGTVLGSFRVEDLIGRGGMAEVYRAQRVGEFDQRVAIKLISGDASSRLDAFQRERRILATLEHPGIARIVDGGITEGGRSYMVMEYVEGTDLIRHAQERKLDLSARLDLFRQVCEAVSYAHRHLIIHRDLKPGNIRVTPEGQVKLLDFGVAKLLQPEGRTEDFETATILTPEFAAPEQLYGQPVTTATDVYALGAVLLHLLCGVPPFRTEGRAIHLVIDQMLRSEMPQPSGVAAAQPDPPIAPRLLRGDLDAIVARAARKKPAERYPTVDELWADIARHLAHLPVVARRGSALYEWSRNLRRHRVAVVAGAAITLAVVAGIVSTLWQARVAMRAEREAIAQAERTERTKDFFVATFAGASALHRKDGTPATLADALDDALRRIDTEQADDPRLQADLLSDLGEIRLGQGDLHGAKRLFERALALHEKLLAPDDPVLAKTLENLGGAESFLGESQSALEIQKRALAIRERHPERADELVHSRLELVTAEINLGHFQAALDQLGAVIAYGHASPQARYELLGSALVNAAYASYQLERLEDAKKLAAEALEVFETHAGRNSIHTATPLRVLARVAADQRDAAAERGLRERALQVAKFNYPQGHPDVTAALVEVASLDLQSGDVGRADDLLVEAIRLADSMAIENDNHVRAYTKLVLSRLRQNRLEEAGQTLAAGLQTCKTERLRDEQALCDALLAAGLRLSLAGGATSPAELLDQAIEATRRIEGLLAQESTSGGASDFDLAGARLAVAESLAALGRHAESAESLRPIVDTRRRIFGGIAADLDGSRWQLAIELAQAGTPASLAEAGRLLGQEAAGSGADAAWRELALARLEQASGSIGNARVHAQAAVRTLGPMGPGVARLRSQAEALVASLQERSAPRAGAEACAASRERTKSIRLCDLRHVWTNNPCRVAFTILVSMHEGRVQAALGIRKRR